MASSDRIKKERTKEALSLIPIIKNSWKPDQIFRAKDLKLNVKGNPIGALKRLSNKELDGIIVLKVGNCESKLWYYKRLGP